MAGKSTISITFKLDGDGKGFKELAQDAEGLKKVITGTVSQAQQLSSGAINFAALATGIDAMQRSFSQLNAVMGNLAGAYSVQEMAETKLQTVMQQRMNATEAQIQKIKELASAQQEIGVIGDEVQLSGAQQVATFLKETESLEVLIPAMNDLVAQQKGLNATTQDAVSVANLMGKAMQGQTSALTRVGITFDEAEAKVLKYGTESEKAAMLAQVITNNVGNMNEELAKTESGKQQQLLNRLGDIKEVIGGMVQGALPFVTIAAQSSQALTSITTLTAGFVKIAKTVGMATKALVVNTATVVRNKVATLAAAAAQKIVAAATKTWAVIQKIMNIVLTANPIGIIVVAIGALIAGVVAAYKHCDKFREICDKVFAVIKPLAEAIMNGLVKALEWLMDKAKQAWEWLKKILGLGGKKAEVEVDVKTNEKKDSNSFLDGLKDKYANYSGGESDGSSVTGKPAPVWNDNADTLKSIGDNIDILNDKLQVASIEEAALINQQIEEWEAKAEAIRNAGKAVEESADPLWKEEAQTLQDINNNIDILTARLQTATVEEAALINQQIEVWNKKADAITNAGKAVEKTAVVWNESAANLKDIGSNIDILNERLQTATVEEAALINQQIEAWNKKADAIKNAGKAVEGSSIRTDEALTKGWSNIKGITGAVESMTEALRGNGTVWQKLCAVIDGFVAIYESIQAVVGIINLLTGASQAHAAAKGVEAGAEITEAGARTVNATTALATSVEVVAANKLAAASYKELAASAYMAAHAYIPFAGFGIGMGFTTAMLAATTAAGIPALAEGGIASAPTLALVGEYAGASGNPEVIAPLDKLRGMIADNSVSLMGGKVEFEIKGRTLIGVLKKEMNLTNRS